MMKFLVHALGLIWPEGSMIRVLSVVGLIACVRVLSAFRMAERCVEALFRVPSSNPTKLLAKPEP